MKFRIVILAAGKGTRMKQVIPKALTPIGGKPILTHLFESIFSSGLEDSPVLVIGKDSPKMGDVIEKPCVHAIQEEQLGTGHAVLCAKEHVSDADAVLVLYGDHPFLSPNALQNIARTHSEQASPVTMATVSLPSINDWYQSFEKWGRILRDEQGNVIGIREYKDATDGEKQIMERNPALFCFDANWLWKKLADVKNENAQGEYYLTDVIAMAFDEGHIIPTVSISPEEAIGINTPEEKEIAEEILHRRHFL